MSKFRNIVSVIVIACTLVSCSYTQPLTTDSSKEQQLVCKFINDLKTEGSPNVMYVNTIYTSSNTKYLLIRYLKESKIHISDKDVFLSSLGTIQTAGCKLEDRIVFIDSAGFNSIQQKDADIRYEGVSIDSVVYYKDKMTPYYPIEIGRPAFYHELAVISSHYYEQRTYFLYKYVAGKWEKVSYIYDPY